MGSQEEARSREDLGGRWIRTVSFSLYLAYSDAPTFSCSLRQSRFCVNRDTSITLQTFRAGEYFHITTAFLTLVSFGEVAVPFPTMLGNRFGVCVFRLWHNIVKLRWSGAQGDSLS